MSLCHCPSLKQTEKDNEDKQEKDIFYVPVNCIQNDKTDQNVVFLISTCNLYNHNFMHAWVVGITEIIQ